MNGRANTGKLSAASEASTAGEQSHVSLPIAIALLPTGAFQVSRRTEFRDTDAAGIVHFSAFFFWMESAEHELLRHVGILVVDPQADGTTLSWPRVSVTCDYKSAVRFGDELSIGVCIEKIGRSSITYGFRFEHQGRWVAQGRVVAVRCRVNPNESLQSVPIAAETILRLKPFCVD